MNDPSAPQNGVANNAIDDYQSMKVNDHSRSPSFEGRDVFHAILPYLHLDAGEVVGGDEYAASFEIVEQRST